MWLALEGFVAGRLAGALGATDTTEPELREIGGVGVCRISGAPLAYINLLEILSCEWLKLGVNEVGEVGLLFSIVFPLA